MAPNQTWSYLSTKLPFERTKHQTGRLCGLPPIYSSALSVRTMHCGQWVSYYWPTTNQVITRRRCQGVLTFRPLAIIGSCVPYLFCVIRIAVARFLVTATCDYEPTQVLTCSFITACEFVAFLHQRNCTTPPPRSPNHYIVITRSPGSALPFSRATNCVPIQPTLLNLPTALPLAFSSLPQSLLSLLDP